MTKSLLRRIDDAICGFAYGHTRRDGYRVRDRILRLSAGRMVARVAGLERSGVGMFPGSQYLLGTLENLGKRLDGPGHTILACELEFFSREIEAARIDLDSCRERIGDPSEDDKRPLPVLPARTRKFQDQLRAGLLEGPSNHFAERQLKVRAFLGHLRLRLFGGSIQACFRGLRK
jgi:hypothetical protein